MRKALLLLAVALGIGCQGPAGSTSPDLTKPELAANGGRWLSTRRTIRTEWTFHPDGRYDALHQEGEVAAQIRGHYRWDNGLLVLDPDRDSVEARSSDKEEANRVQDRLSKGYVLTITPGQNGEFSAKPDDGGEALKFERSG